MIDIVSFIHNQAGNQFVGGGLVLMMTGSVVAMLHKTPKALAEWMKRKGTSEVEVLNSDPLFGMVTEWLDSHPYSKRSRKVTATTASELDDDCPQEPGGSKKKLKVLFSPSPGTHWFFYHGRLIILDRSRENGAPGTGGNSFKKSESYTITILGRDQRVIRNLIYDVIDFSAVKQEGIKIFYSTFGYWQSAGMSKPRKIDSVVLPQGVAESVLQDARSFLQSADRYRALGIPWHRGYLFHGVPGSGKTSLAAALAGELGMDLYLLNLGGNGMNDEKLSSLMSDIRPGCMILMEDVDCTVPDRDSKGGDKVTLSGLLNCLDGVLSREGCMIFMTTNYAERLDGALRRPGRIDVPLEFTVADESQVERMHRRFGDSRGLDQVLLECYGMTMAQVQGYLMDRVAGVTVESTTARAVVQ